MHESERIYRQSVKCAESRRTQDINWKCFKSRQREFDRHLKKKKRAYHKGIMISMEQSFENNPGALWDYVRKLGLNKMSKIPCEVEINGTLVTDPKLVLDKWRSDFMGLYKVDTTNFNTEFKEKKVAETAAMLDSCVIDDNLNREPSLEEVRRTVEKSKDRKAVGMDSIPNELLKNREVMVLLH